MAREKATITLDRAKLNEARELVGGRSTSEVIDTALARLIQAERLRRDIAAYSRQPTTASEMTLADQPVQLDLGDDDFDYEALYERRA
jgi:hypothetical protein